MVNHTLIIRAIKPNDNPYLAKIIRSALEEFGANKPGTVYFDPTTDALFELFQTPGSAYFVAEEAGELLGGAGFFPTNGLPDGIAELVKMYLRPEARGLGLAKLLINKTEEMAKKMGYAGLYLESMPELANALTMYEKMGYHYLEGPMGNSGHSGCGLWMFKNI
ncbi:MAG TPA: GNAT family N-acetyltransferase [Saprospiraceae bacterium]|nr:GNAT family N-acetyltransferase [Saprospiraceae bacterium]